MKLFCVERPEIQAQYYVTLGETERVSNELITRSPPQTAAVDKLL